MEAISHSALAEAVGPDGRVYAVDTDARLLESVRNGAGQRGHTNVKTILAKDTGPTLPEESVDLIFMRNVTHHVDDRTAYFSRLGGMLAPGGRGDHRIPGR